MDATGRVAREGLPADGLHRGGGERGDGRPDRRRRAPAPAEEGQGADGEGEGEEG